MGIAQTPKIDLRFYKIHIRLRLLDVSTIEWNMNKN